MANEFKWSDLDPSDRVVPSIRETAVYTNPMGHVVIRQEAHGADEEDDVVVLPPDYAEMVARKILEVIGELRDGQR
ncbi:MAG: hypothetical protein ACLGJC_09020 [Alphaproteobacteria bacterium]